MEMRVKEQNGERKLVLTEDQGIDFGPGISTMVGDEHEAGGYLKDQSMPFGDLRVGIKNTKTGELKLIGRLDYEITFADNMFDDMCYCYPTA